MARPHSKRKRNPGATGISRSGALLHWIGMVAMVVGLFAPLVLTDSAFATVMTPERTAMKAAQQPFDRDTADFNRVVLVGNFQSQLGCGDWDASCDLTTLQDNNGFWTGVFNVPPGQHDWELIAIDRNGTQFEIDDDDVNVGDGQLGIYAEFNSASRESNVSAVTNLAVASGVFGTVALAEEGDGFVASAINVPNDGWVDLQVSVNGESIATGANFAQGTNRVTFDNVGNITDVESLGYAEVTVQRVDVNGDPLPGSCFELDGSTESRGCDLDGSQDGVGDGTVTLRFPGGFDPGTYTLRETQPADGQEPLADQQVDVQSGQSVIEARSEGEPEPETGDLVVLRQDLDGNPVGWACFELVNAEGEVVASACDDDGDLPDDGRIGLLDVPAGDYTLRESTTPDGFETTSDVSVTVLPNQVTEQTVQSASTAPETGDLVVLRQDQDGNPVGWACFEIVNAAGETVASACDQDGDVPDDGRIGLLDVPAGDYTLREITTPDGYEPAGDVAVTVIPNQVTEQVVSSAAILPDDPDPIETEEPIEEPTEEVTEVATEEVTEPPIDVVTEESTEEPTEVVTEEATEVATEAPISRIVIYREDGQGNRVGGSCFAAVDSDGQTVSEYCDEDGIAPDDGAIGVEQVPHGEYTLVETRVPEGYEQAPDTEVTVGEGDNVTVISAPALPATEEPAETVTPEPTEEVTEVVTEEPTADVPGDPAAVLEIEYDYDADQPVACVELETTGGIIGFEIPYACDNGDNDLNPELGVIEMAVDSPGQFDLIVYQGPAEVVDAPTRQVDLAVGSTVTETFETQEPETTSFTVQTVDADGAEVGGACYILDEEREDCADDAGLLTFTDVMPGEHSVRMTSAPDGYNVADPDTQWIEVAADGSTSVTFTVSRSTTSFTVQTVDADGAEVGGACYILDEEREDCADEAGSLTFTDVMPGEHSVRMTSVPDGYNVADPDTQWIEVAGDGSTSVTFTVSRAPVSFTVETVDADGNPVGGACFSVNGWDPFCDDGSGSRQANVLPGEYSIAMTSAPEGYELPDPASQDFTAAPDGSTVVTFTVSEITVDISITTVDIETNETLVGACYTLDGSEVECDDEGTGQVVFENEVPGDKQLSMETAPEGYEPAADQVIPAGVANLEVGLQAETGSIVVTIVDMDDNPLPGACVQLEGAPEPVCDEADGDNNGTITFTEVAYGTYDVTITSAPGGYDLPETVTQEAEVSAEADGAVRFQLVATPPATGNLDVTVLYGDDSPVEDVCVTVTHATENVQESDCATVGDNVVSFADLPTGTYSVGLQEGFEPDRAIETWAPVSVDVLPEETASAALTLPLAATTGTLQITVVSEGVNVEGACFTVGTVTVCDGEAGVDIGPTPGVIELADLEEGDYDVVMTTVPGGYEQPPAQTVTITAGTTTAVEFNLVAEDQPGSITVQTMDADGDLLTDACYRVVQNGVVISSLCDTEPADGEILFHDIPAGQYQLVQFQRPGREYQTAPTRFVEVAAGEDTLVEVVMELRTGSLVIITADRDEQTLILENACYLLVGATEYGPFCDSSDGNVDGRVRFGNLPAGEYELRQTVAPAGYEPAADRSVTIGAGGTTQITVLNTQVQPPAERGTLVVIPLDPDGNPVEGGCYQVFDGDTPVSHRICDNADDQPARITFENLRVGDLTLREMLAPSPDWVVAADISVTIRDGETTTVEVPHELKRGNVVIQAVNSVGLPLQGACFMITDAGDMELCTDSTGQATVSGLVPGTRELTQTEAPFGYRLNETPREITVLPGQTITVRVVFEHEPPPNTGTVQVQKFYCPAGDDGERTRFLGGAQGNQELKQTAGCEPGIASFTLEAEDGSTESNATFSTTEEGRAQLTAVEGIYLLTETDPDLAGNSAARIRVGTGQMTTVIVINYIEPPAPAPVTINVEGYTCPPGFTGSSFEDFQESCMAESQLTNQITVRAQDENRYRRTTGDTGQLGRTIFTDLPAGTYTIWAERPHTVPVSYLFCGADANNPNQKAVNGSLTTTLQSGSTILCRVFQVPPLFDADHGAIQVEKYNCPLNERQRGFDYQNECSRATEQVTFEIEQVDPKTRDVVGQPVRVNTNPDGIAQFPMLLPGTYKLTEIEGEWCFAQSNSVDARGDVVVNKNQLSEVWVYNCVGTKAPPNTGSGDAADLVDPGERIAPIQVLPNLVWPTVLFGGWMAWQDRKQA